jgi:hypothetical protein
VAGGTAATPRARGRRPDGHELPPEVAGTLLATWGRLHGGTSLEVFGHHHWIFPDGAAALYRADMERMLDDLGITARQGEA